MGPVELRNVEERDWAAIDRLANVAVTHARNAPIQSEWSRNRRSFRGCRRHYVAVLDGLVVGYGALERSALDPPHDFRLFQVLDWTNPGNVAEALIQKLERDLSSLEATTVWMREYSFNQPLVDFFAKRGFSVSSPYQVGG